MSDTDPLSQSYSLLSVARSSLEIATEALALFQERQPAIVELPADHGHVIEGRKVEWSRDSVEQRRGIIGALAFQSSLVMVSKCVERLTRVKDQPAHIVERARQALETINSVVDRQARNTSEHLDERAIRSGDQSLIANTIFEGDLFCSTRADGTLGAIAVTQATLKLVAETLDGIFWTPEQIEKLQQRHGYQDK